MTIVITSECGSGGDDDTTGLRRADAHGALWRQHVAAVLSLEGDLTCPLSRAPGSALPEPGFAGAGLSPAGRSSAVLTEADGRWGMGGLTLGRDGFAARWAG